MKKLLIILYIIMIPISYKITSQWEKRYFYNHNIDYTYRTVAGNIVCSLFWPLDMPISLFMFNEELLNTTPPSWL